MAAALSLQVSPSVPEPFGLRLHTQEAFEVAFTLKADWPELDVPEGSGPMGELVRLRRREREVLGHVLSGAAYKSIAARMGLSLHTVHDYVKSIFRRLGVSSRGELQARYRPAEQAPATGKAERLRPREREVLGHLLSGIPHKHIAAEMGLSVHTVHDYVKAIFRAYDVSSRSELQACFRKRRQ